MHLQLHRRKRLNSMLTLKLISKSVNQAKNTSRYSRDDVSRDTGITTAMSRYKKAFSRHKKATGYKNAIAIASLLFTASCATQSPAPSVDATKSKAPQVTTSPKRPSHSVPKDQATPLPERNISLERAQYYQDLANGGGIEQQIDAQLSAAENYIQAKRFEDAKQPITGLATQGLTKEQRDRLSIINAYISYSEGDNYGALSKLNTLLLETQPQRIAPSVEEQEVEVAPSEDTDTSETIEVKADPQPIIVRQQRLNTQQVDALLLSSFCYQKLGNYDAAISALITREGALTGQARTETTRYIWQVINFIDIGQRQLIIDSSNNPLVANRLEQSLQGQVSQQNIAPQQFRQWANNEQTASEKQLITSNWGENSARKIAVLLPLTSKFNKAAQAVMDGIKYQNEINSSEFRPELQFYDIGADQAQTIQYYNAAIQNGADFIIGPLGKGQANQIARQAGARTPTILLGGDVPVGGAITRLTMSPELEGIRVAERALKEGHLNAAILANDSRKNQRTIDAFSQHWLQAGGKINTVVRYDKSQYDHSPQLKQMFDITSSESRMKQLSDTLGFKPKFSAHQRNDLDFIFMLSDNQSGRIVRPQINFFSGSKIPVYSTSDIFNGIPDSINNIDLDNTQFPIMPWVFKSKESSAYAGQLNMLFAMGADAYIVAGNFNELKQNKDSVINANTGQLNINHNSEIAHQPLWAKFKNGDVILSEAYKGNLDLQTTPTPSLNGINTQNKKGIYNDKTWDSGESRRKVSP